MKNLGYTNDYEWSENHVGQKDNLSFLPEKLKRNKFFTIPKKVSTTIM